MKQDKSTILSGRGYITPELVEKAIRSNQEMISNENNYLINELGKHLKEDAYSCDKNIYWLYDCAANFFEELPITESIEQVDSSYHRVTTTSGEYCGFCFGTFKETSSELERHHMNSAIRPELAHDRFVEMDTCADCGYSETAYTAAKAVIADYFGVVDGQPHTVTVSDLSDAGVTTAIRYGNEAGSCTLTSAPNYTEAGDYPVYYEITYTYHDTDIVEDGVAFVHLRDETTTEDGSCSCGCGNPDCGCQDPDCDGCCCEDKGCGDTSTMRHTGARCGRRTRAAL